MDDIIVLKNQGFFFIKKLADGTYKAHNTTYYGLYIIGNVVVRTSKNIVNAAISTEKKSRVCGKQPTF